MLFMCTLYSVIYKHTCVLKMVEIVQKNSLGPMNLFFHRFRITYEHYKLTCLIGIFHYSWKFTLSVLLHWVCIALWYHVTNMCNCTLHCKTTLAYTPDSNLTLWHVSASCICIAIQLVYIFCVILQLLHWVSSGFSRYFLSICPFWWEIWRFSSCHYDCEL